MKKQTGSLWDVVGGDTSEKKEAKNGNGESAPKTPAEIELEKNFAQFWDAFPVKKDKGHAMKAFKKVAEFLPQMLEAIERQEEEREARASARLFVAEWKYPATWLNGRCWEDEVAVPQTPPQSQRHYRPADER